MRATMGAGNVPNGTTISPSSASSADQAEIARPIAAPKASGHSASATPVTTVGSSTMASLPPAGLGQASGGEGHVADEGADREVAARGRVAEPVDRDAGDQAARLVEGAADERTGVDGVGHGSSSWWAGQFIMPSQSHSPRVNGIPLVPSAPGRTPSTWCSEIPPSSKPIAEAAM